jgi:hypothetical protein
MLLRRRLNRPVKEWVPLAAAALVFAVLCFYLPEYVGRERSEIFATHYGLFFLSASDNGE